MNFNSDLNVCCFFKGLGERDGRAGLLFLGRSELSSIDRLLKATADVERAAQSPECPYLAPDLLDEGDMCPLLRINDFKAMFLQNITVWQ